MLRSASNPRDITSAWIVSRSSSHRSAGRAGRGLDALDHPVGATHAMTLEWVKCCLGPRISQSPLSGRSQAPSGAPSVPSARPRIVGACQQRTGQGQAVQDLAPDIQLELSGRAVPGPHRRGPS